MLNVRVRSPDLIYRKNRLTLLREIYYKLNPKRGKMPPCEF